MYRKEAQCVTRPGVDRVKPEILNWGGGVVAYGILGCFESRILNCLWQSKVCVCLYLTCTIG